MAVTEGQRLAGKVALVTGASSGIGRATAVALAAEGASVAVTARRTERLAALVREIEGDGGAALSLTCDVRHRDEVQAVADRTLEEYGTIDILVNNAGVMSTAPITELRTDDWAQMVDVNLSGVLHFLGAVLPAMLDRKSGHIVNVGSLASRRPFPGGSVYSATKFAVRALSWGLHLELGSSYGIRVTDIQPGVVASELFDHDPKLKAAFAEAWEGKRQLDPADIARAIVFATTSPEHVSVSELLVRPTDQPT